MTFHRSSFSPSTERATPPPYHRNPLRAVVLRLSSVIFFIVGGLFSEIALRKKWGAVAGRISSEGVDDWDVWCLLFVLIRQGLRGGSGPLRLTTAPGIETGNPIMTFEQRSSFLPRVLQRGRKPIQLGKSNFRMHRFQIACVCVCVYYW